MIILPMGALCTYMYLSEAEVSQSTVVFLKHPGMGRKYPEMNPGKLMMNNQIYGCICIQNEHH